VPAFHSVYGLRLRSNRPVPGLKPLPPSEPIDGQVWLGEETPDLAEALGSPRQILYVSPYYGDLGKPLLTVSAIARGDYFEFQYDDDTQFIVDQGGTRIWATWADNSTIEDTATYLLGPVLGFVLRRRGVVCLHASAVVIDGQAVALVGPPGAGKSTTAAAFAKLGYPVLADDVAALDERGDRFFVQPGYPRLCLRSDAVASLYGSANALPRITPNWDKRRLDLNENGLRFQPSPCPLAAIYLLGGGRAKASGSIERVPPGNAVIELVANTHVNYLLDPRQRAVEFELLGRLLIGVPAHLVAPDKESLAVVRLCGRLVEHFQSTALHTTMAANAGPRGAHGWT
jgi:hypothetical protein